ncbi:putative HipA-like kinase domain-containing protein [Gammaproteobacteria bacterium]
MAAKKANNDYQILDRVELVPGTLTPLERGMRGTHLCVVRLGNETHRAYVKQLTATQIAAERFCAALMRSAGLSTLLTAVVEIEGSDWFCSLDAEYPDLSRRFGIPESRSDQERLERFLAAVQVVSELDQTPLATALDELVGNGDRTLENILSEGGKEAIWIDHERAFDLDKDINQLVEMVLNFTADAAWLRNAAIAQALQLNHDVIRNAGKIHAQLADTESFMTFVKTHAGKWPGRLMDRFPSYEKDLFSP